MDMNWESEIASLLGQLSGTQQKLLKLLESKRELLINRDHVGLRELATQEQQLCEELQACHQRRKELLEKAEQAGLPSDSMESLAGSLPGEAGKSLGKTFTESKQQSHLLRHQSISQWVVVQRTLLHLSQLLEIVATGGQGQSTYGREGKSASSGRLMDQAV